MKQDPYVLAIILLFVISGVITWATLRPIAEAPAQVEAVERDAQGATPRQRQEVVRGATWIAPEKRAVMRSIPEQGQVTSFPSSGLASPTDLPGEAAAIPSEITFVSKALVVIPPSNEVGPTLPLIFHFTKRPSMTKDEKANGRYVIEGALFSSAEKPISVTITESSDSSEVEQTEISVEGGVQYRFGSKNGLHMESGDTVSIQSPGYRDLVQKVP